MSGQVAERDSQEHDQKNDQMRAAAGRKETGMDTDLSLFEGNGSAGLDVQVTHFISEGVRCAGTLYAPKGATRPPVVMLIHGWGGMQETLTPPFIASFARAGWASFTFDYRGWGESEGEPRHVIKPWTRTVDAENALAHLKTLPVDTSNIVLWGSSLGGGHMVELAARHPELRGGIGQVPMLDGLAAALATPLPRFFRFGLDAITDLFRGKNPIYIKTVSEPGAYGSMDRDGAWAAKLFGESKLQKSYDNRIAARSLLTMAFYRPYPVLKKIKIPVLLIGGRRDSVAPFVEKKIRAANNPNLRVTWIDANHFDPYLPGAFEPNIAMQLDFLREIAPAA